MKEITPHLTENLEQHFKGSVTKEEAFPIRTFANLIEIVAELSYLNRDNLIFFRGQLNDYKNELKATTLYPSFYRKKLSEAKLQYDFLILKEISKILRF
jgi:hypothetical protein